MEKLTLQKSIGKIVLVILLTGLVTAGISQSDVNARLFEKKPSGRQQWSIKVDAGHGVWMFTFDKNRKYAYDPSANSTELYWQVQSKIREIMGPGNWIMGCDAEGGASQFSLGAGIYDSKFTLIQDVYADWGAEFPELIKKLPDERLQLYKKTMPAVDITPIDLFPFRSESKYAALPKGYPSEKNFPKALDLKVNSVSGVYDVVALYNWSDTSAVRSVSFGEDLGLCTKKQYLVFDFWKQSFSGIFKDQIQVEVPPHGTSVFIVRPLQAVPQLLATSRHITGAYSIKQLTWDPSKSAMNGLSETVSGTKYSLFIYVPDGIVLSKVDSDTKVLFQKLENNLLEVAFKGKKHL